MVLPQVNELYDSRDKRARELSRQGKKIIGYFCCFSSPEIITAAGAIPYRIMGSIQEPVSMADSHIETIVCPYVRSCLELGLKGKYDFLDGLVMGDTCDNIALSYNIFRHYVKPSFAYYMVIPHVLSPSAYEYFKGELIHFSNKLSEYTGQEVTTEGLRRAIHLHNETRGLVRELYYLRKQDPPPISGSEMTRLLVAGMSLPAAEFSQLLRPYIKEIGGRKEPRTGKPRLLISSAELDDTAFIELVEQCGANVVIDDMCIGTKYYWHDIEVTEDPYDGLTRYYLDKITCPRTVRQDLDDRFGYLKQLAEEFKVNGVICYTLKYCDPRIYDIPDMRDYLEKAGFPCLNIEDDYSMRHSGGLKTRIEAFLEVLSAASV